MAKSNVRLGEARPWRHRLETVCDERSSSLDAIVADEGAAPELRARARTLHAQFTRLREAYYPTMQQGCAALLGLMHEFQRLQFLSHANATPEMITAVDAVYGQEPNWRNLPELEAAPELRASLAGRIIHSMFQHRPGASFPNSFEDGPPLSRDKVILSLSPSDRGTVEHIVAYCLRYDIPFDIDFSDERFKKTLLDEGSMDQAAALATYNGAKHEGYTRHIKMISKAPADTSLASPKDPNAEKKKRFEEGTLEFEKKRRTGEVFYVLTRIPTEEDAATEHMPYNEYLKLFFELCDQPWAAIQEAQKKLIARLEQSKTLRIVDEEAGTDLSMEIEGNRWANSVVLKNIPGSEVFSAPKKESVNGTYVAKGRFQDANFNTEVMEDIWFKFEHGRIVDFGAKTGYDTLKQILERDAGNGDGVRFLGEIGIGTNPWIKQHVLNPLLVEKISGSCHIALGSSYSFKTYDGEPISVDNGNRSHSGTHWDVTALLQGAHARIELDNGQILLERGRFTDPDLAVLNDGWATQGLEDQVPIHWKTLLAARNSGKAATPAK